MKIVLQRVKEASVRVDGQKLSSIGKGLLVLVGVEKGDTVETAGRLAGKISRLRIFEDDRGKMNLDVKQVSGAILSVSQFTLLGDIAKGNRPGFDAAELPGPAELIWRKFNETVAASGIPVEEGKFGARMEVDLINDGPVTFVIEGK